jgi:hypothetical protein
MRRLTARLVLPRVDGLDFLLIEQSVKSIG